MVAYIGWLIAGFGLLVQALKDNDKNAALRRERYNAQEAAAEEAERREEAEQALALERKRAEEAERALALATTKPAAA